MAGPYQQEQYTDFFGKEYASPREKLQARAREMMLRAPNAMVQSNIAKEAAAIERGERSDPQYEADLKREQVRSEILQNAYDKGVTPDGNPTDFAALAVSTILRHNYPGSDKDAMLVANWAQVQAANKRAAQLEEAQIAKLNAEAENSGGKGRGEYFVPVQTAEGVRAFDARSGRVSDPSTGQLITKPVVGSASDVKLQGDLASSKKYGEDVAGSVATVGGKYDALDSVRQAQEILKKGVYAGYWGDAQRKMAKAMPGADKTKAANTEEFMSYIGNTVVPRLKEFGGNDSNEELKYLQKIQGGDLEMEPEALSKVLTSVDRKIQVGIKRLRQQAADVGRTLPDQPTADSPKPTAAKGGGAVPEGATATNRKTGQRLIFKGGKWQPLK